jgi:hypothetical protein
VAASDTSMEQRRRARRAALLLGLVAAAVYVGFIVMTFFRYH